MATVSGGQLSNVVCPRKTMAESETQEFDLLNFFQRVVEKVDERGFNGMVLSERK